MFLSAEYILAKADLRSSTRKRGIPGLVSRFSWYPRAKVDEMTSPSLRHEW